MSERSARNEKRSAEVECSDRPYLPFYFLADQARERMCQARCDWDQTRASGRAHAPWLRPIFRSLTVPRFLNSLGSLRLGRPPIGAGVAVRCSVGVSFSLSIAHKQRFSPPQKIRILVGSFLALAWGG